MNRQLKTAYIIAAGIALNITGRAITSALGLPVWMDMCGTFISTYYTGLWGGVATAVLSSILAYILTGASPFYCITGVLTAALFSFFVNKGYMSRKSKAAISSFWLGVLCVIVSTPINLLVSSGYSGNIWGDALVDMLLWYNIPLIAASAAGQAVVDIVDKQICVLGAYIVIRRINIGNIIRKSVNTNTARLLALFLSAGLIFSLSAAPLTAYADAVSSENYTHHIYNNTNGLVSSDANVICGTDDGNIWIGSYAGLTRFNGTEFEFIRENGLVSIVNLMKDHKGRLWIATNDSGLACYSNGEYTFYNTMSGLPSDSVRCFAEDSSGNIYIGTTEGICIYTSEGTIEKTDYEAGFVKSIAISGGILSAVDNNGCLWFRKENSLERAPENDDHFFITTAATSEGFAAGTDSGEIILFSTESGTATHTKITVSGKPVTALYEDSFGRLWAGNEAGFGYVDKNMIYTPINERGFNSSICGIYEDYQHNIWLASQRCGIMKLSGSCFVNIFGKSIDENTVVNAVEMYDRDYYIGTDKGVIIIDGDTHIRKYSRIATLTSGIRVRALCADSSSRLWICTYSDHGLICLEADGNVTYYNSESGATENRFRCVTELSDGTIAAGTANGLNFIRDGKIVSTVTSADGLDNSQILTISEKPDGTVLAGTDGAGIYELTDGRITGTITTANGLSSEVILRIVPHNDGFFVVTSNALCHIDSSGAVKELRSFPYYNNYDILINGTAAYITCSAGLFRADISDLCADRNTVCRLFDAGDGLVSGLTPNSWNYLSDDGTFFLCGNNGVLSFTDSPDDDQELRFGLEYAEYNGKTFRIIPGGPINIPNTAKQLTLTASVHNYALSDAKVRFFAEGSGSETKLYDWDNIEPVIIAGMSRPGYTIHLQVLDSSGEKVIGEETYSITRDIPMWEKSWYRFYLVAVIVEILVFTTISVVNMFFSTRRREELEQLQKVLENKVKDQTDEIWEQSHKTEELFLQTISALSGAVDAKDRYTSGHSKRVAEYAGRIAERMGKSREEQEEIYRAGLLHDVGKIRVPGEIINKAGKLTDEEFALIKIHPVTGYQILRKISGSDIIALGAKFHHERYDGKGYPTGLEGNEIPEVARILGVADSYDAMASNRSYRKALPQDVVRAEIEKGRGTQFDPAIADIMLQMMDEDTDYNMKETDSLTRNILVVDDEPMNITMISHFMKNEPMYNLISVTNGMDALKELDEKKIDLVLLDVFMPDMDGLETLSRIRQKSSVPVVFMTGDKKLETMQKAASLGCDDYITKPFQPLLLKEVIHSMTVN